MLNKLEKSNKNSKSAWEVPVDAFLEKLITLRKELHQYPELSGYENETVARIQEVMASANPSREISGLGGHSIAFIFEGEQPGPTTLLRCELDALPIQEDLPIPHCSSRPGVSHKCGHDGHMAILAGIGLWLGKQHLVDGQIILLFQSAEETGEGARALVKDPAFHHIQPDYAFALHNLPGYPLGTVMVKSGTFNCASRGIIIELEGHTSHAAHPEEGNSPALAMCELIKYLDKLPADLIPGEEIAFATVVHAKVGEIAFGTSPGKAVVMATLRAETNGTIDKIYNDVIGFSNKLCRDNQLRMRISEQDVFDASINHPEAVDKILFIGKKYNNVIGLIHDPYRWSEDFGAISNTCKGAMFGLGAGEGVAPLHHPDYDFPDELISIGMDMMQGIIQELHTLEVSKDLGKE